MTNNKPSHKPWYRKWWGILIVICIWPYFLTWYAWTRSRWSKLVRVAVTALSVVAVLISIGIAAASSNPQSPTTANSTNAMTNNQSATGGKPQSMATLNNPSDNTVSTLTVPSTTPSTPPQPQTLLDISGQGTKQTQQFTTTGNWTLAYNYDCSSFGTQGNFQVVIYNSDGSMDTNDMLVNQLGTNGSDTEYYYDAGTFYLSVNSECSWHVTVKG